MSDLERVRAGLERVVRSRVKTLPRAAGDECQRSGGSPTRLPEPFPPYRGVLGAPGFPYAVASGAAYTAERGGGAGIHHVRRDENDPAEGRFNTDSDIVIEDLVADEKWLEVLRVAALAAGPELQALVLERVFALRRPRGLSDHILGRDFLRAR